MRRELLLPLSWVYGALTQARNWLYDHALLSSYRPSIPVISIGNVSCGGSGKTPLTIFLAQELLKLGKKPVILAKGYYGTLRLPTLVKPCHSPKEVGDEALLMQNRIAAPVVVSWDKTAGARFIETNQLGDIIILDDGLQHRSLSRDLDIVCIDVSSPSATKSFVEGSLLPAGRLRESRKKALERAHLIVFSHRKPKSRAETLEEALLGLVPSGTPYVESYYEAQGVFSLSDKSMLSPQRVIAFSAIANPEGFLSSLQSLGFEVVAHYELRDHETFSNDFLKRISKRAPELPLVCTEKDAIKIGPVQGLPIYEMQISLSCSEETARMVEMLKLSSLDEQS